VKVSHDASVLAAPQTHQVTIRNIRIEAALRQAKFSTRSRQRIQSQFSHPPKMPSGPRCELGLYKRDGAV
jgi:formyltetrahydrofolate synthetase